MTVESLAAESTATILTGPLVPLLPPRTHRRTLPTLPLRTSSQSPFGPTTTGWTCDTFVIPAAFPRSIARSSRHPSAGAATPLADGERVDLNKALLELYTSQAAACSTQVDVRDAAQMDEQEQLFLSVNRYSRATPRAVTGTQVGLTLVFAHANGFHKEIFEPTISELLNCLDDTDRASCLPVDEIWALDCVCQGDSAVLNDGALGETFYWADVGRDILNLVISYIDTPSATPPTSLAPIDASPTLLSLDYPAPGPTDPSARLFRNRLIVGLGHSVGGCGMTYASSAIPSLFSSIILLDPVLPPENSVSRKGRQFMTSGALVRREKWGSREEAKEGFLKKEFFRMWDPRALDRYIEFGLREVVGGVALKATARSEATVFADPMVVGSSRGSNRLRDLPTALPVHFILADIGKSVLDEESLRLTLEEIIPHSSSVRIEDVGHLLVQEKPKRTAEEIARFLRRLYPATGRKVGKL